MPAGRPTKYKSDYPAKAEKLCKLGATDADLADFFGVATNAIWRWSTRYPEFCSSLKVGKAALDAGVERSLYQRAKGYEYDSVKIFQHQGGAVVVPYREKVPPDTTACIFWLKNRNPKDWRDKIDFDHSGKLKFDDVGDKELARRLAFVLAQGAQQSK